MEYRPNYNNRKRKKVSIVNKKRCVVAVLLTASIGMSATYGVYNVGKNVVNKISDNYYYGQESSPYFEMVDSKFRTNPANGNKFIDMSTLSDDFKSLEFTSKDDVYHALIECARFMRFNLDKNFDDLLIYLNLDKLSSENSIYPTRDEVYDYLSNKGFIKEDGTIDFNSWRDYDREVFNAERKLDNLKEGKAK